MICVLQPSIYHLNWIYSWPVLQNINPLIAKRMTEDRGRDYMNARRVAKELEAITRGLNKNLPAIPPQNTPDELQQVKFFTLIVCVWLNKKLVRHVIVYTRNRRLFRIFLFWWHTFNCVIFFVKGGPLEKVYKMGEEQSFADRRPSSHNKKRYILSYISIF